MNLKYYLLSVLTLAAFTLSGCKPVQREPDPEITLTGETASLASSGLSVNASGGDTQITSNSATDWHIDVTETKALVSWLVVTPASGKAGDITATVSVQPNQTLEPRAASISIISGSINKSIAVKQSAREFIAINSVALNETKYSFYVGDTFQLTASVTPTNADEDRTVSWSSSNEKTVSVKDGLITALAEGKATITAKAGSISATCEVTVEHTVVNVESITLDVTALELKEGETKQLTATVLPANADDKTVTWTSSNESVASVSNGLVTAIARGTATITAKAGGKSASCELKVERKGSGGEDMDTPVVINPWGGQ